MARRFTFKEVKKYFEDHNCELFETEYINNSTKMKFRCNCGNPDCKISFASLRQGHRCKKCRKYGSTKKLTYEKVKQYFEDHDCELFETEYKNDRTPMKFRCDCGNKKCKITFNNFRAGQKCMECSGNKKFTYEEVRQYFEDHNCELLEIKYINSQTPMEYRCDCGNDKCKIRFADFKSGSRCKECAIERVSGKNHHHYNFDLTDEERKRKRNSPEDIKWRKDVFERDNYTCQYCRDNKGGNLNAHHLESYDINVELRLVVSNGITLCEKHHIEFHKKYGYGNNTTEQFEEYLITMNLVIN